MPDRPLTPAHRTFYLWPENVPAWSLFQACGTQWRQSMEGATGLDYPGCEVVMRRRRIPQRDRDRMFCLLQAMERGALKGWHQLREERKANQPGG